jgi:hypothetical protein
MSQTKDFNEAKQLFFAQFGNALVTNTYLKSSWLVSAIAWFAGSQLQDTPDRP